MSTSNQASSLSEAPRFRIVHDRDTCIGCGACAALLDKQWIMADDGKADPARLELGQADFEMNKEAADSCPVNVIHIEDVETGERLI